MYMVFTVLITIMVLYARSPDSLLSVLMSRVYVVFVNELFSPVFGDSAKRYSFDYYDFLMEKRVIGINYC